MRANNNTIEVSEHSLEPSSAMNNTIELKNVQYFCVFCDSKFSSKELAYRHYQCHLDYYPIMCLTCGEGLPDLQSFVTHHIDEHKHVLKGRYKKKEQPIIDTWISSFLYSQATIKAFPPREQCIVCDRVFTREDVAGNRPRRCTINRRIDHLHRHLCYLPYECLLCKQSGAEFFVAYFESKAHSHIKQKHPEIDDDESRWQIFQKTVSIVKLDDLIENYLSQFGITMQLERRPVKKPRQFFEQQGIHSTTLVPFELNENSLNTDLIFGSNDSDNDVSVNTVANISKNSNKPFDLIVIDDSNDMYDEEYNSNSNDNDMVVNVSPHSLIDKSIRFSCEEEDKYFCVFCSSDKYFSRTDAYSHYGEHLDYLPVVCNTCGAKFSNVDRLMNHHKSNHLNASNVNYEIIEDQILMEWVNEFLESQVDKLKSSESVMECECSSICPVCIKLNKIKSLDQKPCAEHNDVSFSVHLHQHLVYYPYECVTCKRNGNCVRVPNLDSIAMSHIKEHKIENASMYQLCKNFPKTLVIPKLEKLIGNAVNSKRVLERKLKIENNVTHAIEPSAGTSTAQSSVKNNLCSTNISPSKVEHIRLEGRRIVNLPPKTPSLNGSNGSVVTKAEVMVSSSARIKCLHCKKYFGSRKLLKTHHIKSHPGLTIACFVPNNISITS